MSGSLGCTIRHAAILSTVFLLTSFSPAVAQSGGAGVIQGIVGEDGTTRPVSGASVTLLGLAREVHTDARGGFEITGVPIGPVTVRVTATGHPSVTQSLNVSPDRVMFVQFWLPTVGATLSEVLVEAGVSRDPARAQAETAADLVANEVPSLRWRRTDVVRGYSTAVRLRGVSSVVQSLEPVVYLDGNLLATSEVLDVLNQIPANEVERVEVLRGPVASFLYPNAANGVIVVTTKR